ncbi:MAG: hypothetical protein IPN34_00445 [Planctomycetes bacterium]|nr:hypothetical protein [Planctomycetota bacterium]
MNRLSFLMPLLLAGSILAQGQPCLHFNDQENSIAPWATPAYASGPALRAFQFLAPSALTLRAATILTTSPFVAQSMGLELWSHDPASNKPSAKLAGVVHRFVQPQGWMGWQGGNFDSAVPVLPGVAYWLVWVDPGGCYAPFGVNGPGATAHRYERRITTSWSSQPGEFVKMRLYCDLLSAPGVIPRGEACSGSTSQLGHIFVNLPPRVGSATFGVEGYGFPLGAPALLLLGANPSFASISLGALAPGCFVHVDAVMEVAGVVTSGPLRALTPPGNVWFGVPIPAELPLVGTAVNTQVLVFDAASSNPLPIQLSNALDITPF